MIELRCRDQVCRDLGDLKFNPPSLGKNRRWHYRQQAKHTEPQTGFHRCRFCNDPRDLIKQVKTGLLAAAGSFAGRAASRYNSLRYDEAPSQASDLAHDRDRGSIDPIHFLFR